MNEREIKTFKQYKDCINCIIKSIEENWKLKYKTYELTFKDKMIKTFLEDVFTVKDINWNGIKSETFYNQKNNENYYFYILLQCAFNPKFNFKKAYKIKRLYPKQEWRVPLWYLFSRLTNYNFFHFFFTPNIFFQTKNDSGIKEDLVKLSNAYFVDIDNLGTDDDLTKWSKKQLEDFLLEKYSFLDKEIFFPSYICASGGGLHLYFILETTEDIYKGKWNEDSVLLRAKHKDITKQLVNMFGADTLCVNLNRLLRMPFSKNPKDKYIEVRETNLIKPLDDYNEYYSFLDTDDFEIYLEDDSVLNYLELKQRMEDEDSNFIYITGEEEALLNNNIKFNQKEFSESFFNSITKNSDNKLLMEPNKTITNTPKINSKPITINKPKNDTKPKRKLPESEIEFFKKVGKDGIRQLSTNRIKDLEDWMELNKNNIDGKRDMFFLIYANILKLRGLDNNIIMNKCFKINNTLSKPLPTYEIEKIINYLDVNVYYYKNETIAKKLDFSINEINILRCNYTEADIQNGIKEKNKRAEEKRKEKRGFNKKKTEQMDIIISNTDKSNQELADLLKVSLSTVKRLKKDIKEFNNVKDTKKRA